VTVPSPIDVHSESYPTPRRCLRAVRQRLAAWRGLREQRRGLESRSGNFVLETLQIKMFQLTPRATDPKLNRDHITSSLVEVWVDDLVIGVKLPLAAGAPCVLVSIFWRGVVVITARKVVQRSPSFVAVLVVTRLAVVLQT